MPGWNLKGFFGYPSFGGTVSWSLAYPELMAGSGHMDAAKLFDAAGFDGILTPHDYQARGIGGVYLPEGMADSAVLRGKYFWGEMDTRSGDKDIGTARNYREWAAITWRNYATGWTRGYNSYWMYGFYIADWFGDKPVQDVIQRQTEVVRESIGWNHETVPGIAMIIDDTAVLETNGSGNFLNEAVMWEEKMGIARCGRPHNIYVFDDLALDNFPKHRSIIFRTSSGWTRNDSKFSGRRSSATARWWSGGRVRAFRTGRSSEPNRRNGLRGSTSRCSR